MAEQDLIANAMGGTQQVPAGMSAEDADNFEEVSECASAFSCPSISHAKY